MLIFLWLICEFVNKSDSIKKILEFDVYPRSGNMFTPGSTGYYLNQTSGATFRVIIDTKDWDNSVATNSPGQSGNPESPFYRNLYETWANDQYFKLLYSRKEVISHLYKKSTYHPKNNWLYEKIISIHTPYFFFMY